MKDFRFKRFLFYFMVFGLLCTIVLYSIYQSKNLISGPQIRVLYPHNGQRISSSSLELEGSASNITAISLNGRPIYVDENGNFKEKLLLPYGYTIIELSATDKFGRTKIKTLEVIR